MQSAQSSTSYNNKVHCCATPFRDVELRCCWNQQCAGTPGHDQLGSSHKPDIKHHLQARSPAQPISLTSKTPLHTEQQADHMLAFTSNTASSPPLWRWIMNCGQTGCPRSHPSSACKHQPAAGWACALSGAITTQRTALIHTKHSAHMSSHSLYKAQFPFLLLLAKDCGRHP